MSDLFTTFDIIIFIASLVAVMGLGLWAGWREDTSADYYLASKNTRWWGVAGSIFGSNVSANHLVGMMGVGFMYGFAQSHFEISAIAGLLLLCYGFLPMYRKLNIYTLSDYLSRRYDDRSRIAYAVIMVIVIVVIQMVPGFYIGSRSLNILLRDGEKAVARAIVGASGSVTHIEIANGGSRYTSLPQVVIDAPTDLTAESQRATAEATMVGESVAAITITSGGSGYDPQNPPAVEIVGGAAFDPQLSPGDVNPTWYAWGIVLMAVVTGTYTILGGLKAVIVTDVIQSLLMLLAGLLLAAITFGQPEVGGWGGMVAMDTAAGAASKLHLYNPPDHPTLPWTGVLTGLMVLHFYYWGTNQFIVQRAMSARSDQEARFGIIAAGFFKLLIPFFSIGTGIAAYYLFQQRGMDVAQDAVFMTLLTELVAPLGFGLVGLVAAGMIGAILSSLDSMMNSAATIITFDVYQRYVHPDASERRLIWVGRLCIVVFILGAASLTIFTADPNSKSNFFLQIAEHQSKLVAGVVVAFLLGMFWKGATAAGAIAAIMAGVVFSYALPPFYAAYLSVHEPIARLFGTQLNFMHSVFLAALLALLVHIVTSLQSSSQQSQQQLTWDGQGVIARATQMRFLGTFGVSLVVFAVLAVLMVFEVVAPASAAWMAFAWTWLMFTVAAFHHVRAAAQRPVTLRRVLANDRFWAGLLAGLAMFMMYYFY